MDYKKQLNQIKALLENCEHKLRELSEPIEFTTPPHVADWQLEDMTDQLGFLIAAAYEGNKLPQLAQRVLTEFEKLPHKAGGEEGSTVSPRVFRAWTYYNALNLIATPSVMEKIEKKLKIFGAFIAVLAGVAGLLKINHDLAATQDLIKKQNVSTATDITTGTLHQ